jgi:DNA-binding SARP family transcriptional activator
MMLQLEGDRAIVKVRMEYLPRERERAVAQRVWYRAELVRCGKPTCKRCCDGPSHGPYYYAYWRDAEGRVRKDYVGKRLPPGAMLEPMPLVTSLDQVVDQGGPPPLRVCLLGGFEVERGGKRLLDRDWGRADARRLLALLLLNPTGLTRDQVMEALWPDHGLDVAKALLKNALSALRGTLEPAMRVGTKLPSQRVPLHEQVIQLHLFAHDWVDVQAFCAELHPEQLTLTALTALVDLYRGELLPEYRYEEWTLGPRERLQERWCELSLLLAQRLLTNGQSAAATARLETILAVDATQEEAVRTLMRLQVEAGRRDEALRVYQRLVETLQREWEAEPEASTQLLAEQVRRGVSLRPVVQHATMLVHDLRRQIDALAARPLCPLTARRLALLWVERAQAFYVLGEMEATLANVAHGKAMLTDCDCPGELSRLLLVEAMVYCRLSEGSRALQVAVEAEQLAKHATDQAVLAEAWRMQAQAKQQLGAIEEAITLARQAAECYEVLGDAQRALRSWYLVAYCIWRAGRFPEAAALQRQNLARARALGQPEQLAYVLCGLGSALRCQGDLAEAEPCLLEALRLAQQLADRYLVLAVEYHLANLWLDRAYLAAEGGAREFTSAQQQGWQRLERLSRLAQGEGDAHLAFFAANDLTMALAQWGECAAARHWLAVAQEMLPQLGGVVAVHGWAELGQAEFALASGDMDGAGAHVAAALPLLQRGSPEGLAQAYRVAAMAASNKGDLEAAVGYWSASLAAAAHCGQKLEYRRTQRAMVGSRRRQPNHNGG